MTPLASRRETQRRAAIALIALLVVVGSLAMSVWAFGGQRQQGAISSINAGQDALDKARGEPRARRRAGHRPHRRRPRRGAQLLTEAYAQLDEGRGGERQRSVSSTRSGRTSSRCSIGRTASSTWRRRRSSRSSRRRGPRRSTCARSSVATTTRRTSSTGRRRRSTASTSSGSGPPNIARNGRAVGGTQDGHAQAPRGGGSRPADPRRQERAVALAGVQRRRARARPTGSR